MGIRQRKEAQSRSDIDKAAYIGMETEHSADTSGGNKEAYQKTINVASVNYFTEKNQRENKSLRIEAYKKQ